MYDNLVCQNVNLCIKCFVANKFKWIFGVQMPLSLNNPYAVVYQNLCDFFSQQMYTEISS